jgi:type IV secretion system protein VirD4
LLPEDEARRLPLDEIVMVVDAQMPVRAKRIQYFDDRLFKAIHAAQTGELPFPKPGETGPQSDLPLSARAMPMTPRSSGGGESDAISESVDHVRGETKQSPPGADGTLKKSATVVQAVVAEEHRQMEMDLAGTVSSDDLMKEADQEQGRSAVDDLNELEAALKQGL